jgi:MFS family permease
MKPRHLTPLLYLTLGWFGLQMAMALDATQFQVLLDRALDGAGFSQLQGVMGPWHFSFGKASVIGLILGLGPLAGMVVQPFMGWLSDRLAKRGISRRTIMRQAVFYTLICTLIFCFKLSLWPLVIAIGLFFVSLNVLSVTYRAVMTQASNRKALIGQKGLVSGGTALFSGLGGFGMFAVSSVFGISPWPAAIASLVVAGTFCLFFRYAPQPKSSRADTSGTVAESVAATSPSLTGFWQWVFYLLPILSLLPVMERKMATDTRQQAIFRLFLVVFFEWVGIQALRAFFVLYATHELHMGFKQANIALAVLTLVTVAASLPLGKMADRISNRFLWMLCLALFATVCLAGWWWVNSMSAVLVMCVLLGLAFAGMIVLPLSQLFRLCPAGSEGAYSGLYNLFLSMPQLYSLLLTGWLVDTMHSYRMILLVGAVTVACALVLTFRLKTPTINSVTTHSPSPLM